MADVVAVALRTIHIFAGVFWAGAALLLAFFLEPAVNATGADGGKVMSRMMGPGKFPIFMTLSAFLTALSGLGLLWWSAQGVWGVWTASTYGYTILAGSIVGLAGFFLGLFINAPTAKKMSDLARAMQSAGRPPSPDQLAEMGRLQHRLHAAALTSAVLLSLTVILMAVARAL